MNTVYAVEDFLAADEYIDVCRKSGLNRPVDDRARVERLLAHSNLFVTARQDGRAGLGFARSLADFCFSCYLSGSSPSTRRARARASVKPDRGNEKSSGWGIHHHAASVGARTALTFYQGIKMPQLINCFAYRRSRGVPASYPDHRISPPFLFAAVWMLK